MKRLTAGGDFFIWLSGLAVALAMLAITGLFFLISVNGLGAFWPQAVYRIETKNNQNFLGQITNREEVPSGESSSSIEYRLQIKQANRDLYGQDFTWLPESQIGKSEIFDESLVLERKEWGDFIGQLDSLVINGEKVIANESNVWATFETALGKSKSIQREVARLSRKDMGALSYAQEQLRIERNTLEKNIPLDNEKLAQINRESEILNAEVKQLSIKIEELRSTDRDSVIVASIDGQKKEIPLSLVVRAYQPNKMNNAKKMSFYFSKLYEFVSESPRESNTEGGIFPAIFGTVMLVLIMSVIVTPFGVLAAIYLREYAKQGRLVSMVRIAVNNLAGVPSIVFGVFGVGFFIYVVGGSIDRLFYSNVLPTPTYGTGGILWASLTLALLTVPTVIVATEEGLAAIPRHLRESSYALGATKFETTFKIVLPALTPSILTGVILAVARAAGEVAPLMITGVVKLAPNLPFDAHWPFFHLDRKFMHLGFHIYDVGFQSPNVEAARPMVYMSTLLLFLIVIALNLSAMVLRNRLRKRYVTSAV